MHSVREEGAGESKFGGAAPIGGNVRVLIYKRKYLGDPDSSGCFGINDCMGSIRSWAFDAVIGVGGIGARAKAEGIAGKLSWIGIGPHKTPTQGRGPEVTFDHFIDLGIDGPQLVLVAPALAERMYSGRARHLLAGVSEREYEEARAILELARNAPPSQRRVGQLDPTCPP